MSVLKIHFDRSQTHRKTFAKQTADRLAELCNKDLEIDNLRDQLRNERQLRRQLEELLKHRIAHAVDEAIPEGPGGAEI